MGRKGSWLCSMKSPKSKEKKEKKTRKLKGWFSKKKSSKGLDSVQEEIAAVNPAPPSPVHESGLVNAEGEQTKYVDSITDADNEQVWHAFPVMDSEIVQENYANLAMDAESEQARHAYAVARASAAAAEAAVAASQAAAEVARLTAAAARSPSVHSPSARSAAARSPSARFPAKSKEEIASLKIQAVFKGHMARRALRSIKGLVRLKTLIRGQSVRRQAATTLRCMQTMTRIQAEVRARRIRMSEENCAFQRQLQQKHHKKEKSRASQIGQDWNSSAQSKEQFEAKQQRKLEAAIKRERTLAYAYAHQQTWKNSSEATPHTFMVPDNPQWGWNWLERWMAVRPWENRAVEKEQIDLTTNAKTATTQAYSRRDLDLIKKPSSQIVAKRQSLTQGKASVSSPRTKTHNVRAQSSRKSVSSVDSVQSERCRRHSVTQSSARGDDESVASSSALPSYMVLTESAKAKSRLSFEKTPLAEKDFVGTPKKRLSFSTSPSTPRRHSLLK